jgi:hypothetical protein
VLFREVILISVPTATMRSASLRTITWRLPPELWPFCEKLGREFVDNSGFCAWVSKMGCWLRIEEEEDALGWSITLCCASWERSGRTRSPRVHQTCLPFLPTIMTSIGTGYDLSASTYSPDGRIFQVYFISPFPSRSLTTIQVEYANKAVENSGYFSLPIRTDFPDLLALELL